MRSAILILLLLILGLPAFGQEFPDVPLDHWAYQAVQELLNAGIIQGYPDGTFGGKRAMTRYEFAEATAKAILTVEMQIKGAGTPGNAGPEGPTGPAGPPGIKPEQLVTIERLLNEFKDELAGLGVDVEAVRRDVVALCDRVTSVENEVGRVKVTGTGDEYGRGEVRNTSGAAFDIDSRSLAQGSSPADMDNPLANSAVFNDFDLNVKGRVSEGSSMNATLTAGNYLNYALARGGSLTLRDNIPDFVFYKLYYNGVVRVWPAGAAELIAGRFALQLTPLTLSFVNPDSYNLNPKLASGDYVFDGGLATFNMGGLSLTAFASKSAALGSGVDNLMRPNLLYYSGTVGIEVEQLAGARAVLGTPLSGNLGLTYYQVGLAPSVGRASIYGADVNAQFSNVGFAAEYAKTNPNDQMKKVVTSALGSDNYAWNAKLSYAAGRFAVGAGYILVKPFYLAPGDWIRTGRAVNLQNVKGAQANVSYSFTSRLSLNAQGSFLEPDVSGVGVTARTSNAQGQAVAIGPGVLDTLTSWKAELKYGLTAANSVNIGWEEATWKPASSSAAPNTKERYITIGLGHTFSPSSSMKLLYQIVDFKLGALDPYGLTQTDYRGGVAAAEFLLKY